MKASELKRESFEVVTEWEDEAEAFFGFLGGEKRGIACVWYGDVEGGAAVLEWVEDGYPMGRDEDSEIPAYRAAVEAVMRLRLAPVVELAAAQADEPCPELVDGIEAAE